MASSKYSSLNNRYVLYFFFLLAIVDITYFVNSGDMKSLMVFILIAVLTSMFNKNMIVVLCLSLVTTHLIKFGSKSYQEGMNNKDVKKYVKEGAKVYSDPGGAAGLANVPAGQEDAVIESADECPGECIFIEVE